ncbi:hypothetical protein COOONC_08156 [Cooperia oncophora]
MQKKCAICGRSLPDDDVRRSSQMKITNGILAASLFAFGCTSAATAQLSYKMCCTQKKYICHKHFVQAGQCMCTVMALMGKQYTPFQGQAIGAYVTLVDIPMHLVDLLNANGKSIGTRTSRKIVPISSCI